jgi:hypothetical protein
MPTLDEILHAKDRVSGRLLQPDSSEIDAPESLGTLSRNFVGVGAGYRVKGGQIQNEMCLVVFVRIKLRPEYLGPYNVASYLKNEIGDFPVDVVETGSFRSLAASYPAGPMSQLVSGADVTMAGRATHGTVCAFALRKGEICLLSCGHVLDSCVNQFKLVVSRQQVVATVVQQADLLPGYGYGWPHQQDAVVAQLSAGVTPNFELPGALGQLSTDTPIPVHPGMAVIKAGKTVESGTVRYPHVKITVDYPSQTSILDNQILVTRSWFVPTAEPLRAQAIRGR